jgi:uncharacterized protein
MSRLLALALFVSVAPPTRWVTDDAGAMSPAARTALDEKLEAYQRDTGHQVVVYIGRTTQGEPIEDWAARTFAQWKIGRQGLDDGVALFVFTQDRSARIEVGYGLEGTLPDALSARILRSTLLPQMATGNVDAAISGTVDAITRTLGGGGQPPLPAQAHPARIAFFVVAFILFIALAIWQPRLAWLLLMMLSGRRGGGRGGGGGGFSGGGGRSGGAGASGRW